MELWQAILTTALSTLVGIIVTDIIVRIKTNGKKYLGKKQAEQQAEIKNIVAEVMEPLKKDLELVNKKIDNIAEGDLKALKKANRDSLRCQLYEIYDRCIAYKTKDDIDNESELFDSYKALNGNHGCDARHKKFAELPTKEEYDYQLTRSTSHK